MTIVAKGPPLFAATQRLETATAPVATRTLRLQLEYEPVGLRSGAAGRRQGARRGGTGPDRLHHRVRRRRGQPPRRTGRIRLASKGAFVTTCGPRKGRVHTFLIELRDSEGRLAPTEPDRFDLHAGAVATNPPLTHSLGVATASNEMDVFLAKGTHWPAGKRKVHRNRLPGAQGPSRGCAAPAGGRGRERRRADRQSPHRHPANRGRPARPRPARLDRDRDQHRDRHLPAASIAPGPTFRCWTRSSIR